MGTCTWKGRKCDGGKGRDLLLLVPKGVGLSTLNSSFSRGLVKVNMFADATKLGFSYAIFLIDSRQPKRAHLPIYSFPRISQLGGFVFHTNLRLNMLTRVCNYDVINNEKQNTLNNQCLWTRGGRVGRRRVVIASTTTATRSNRCARR